MLRTLARSIGTLRIASPRARNVLYLCKFKKKKHRITPVRLPRAPKLTLTSSEIVYNQIILAWMLLLKTLKFCGIVWIVKVIQGCDSPTITNKATKIYEE